MTRGWLIVVFALVVGAGGWLLVQLLICRGKTEYRARAQVLDGIAALPFDEAAARALPLLQDNQLFRCVEATAEGASLEWCAPALRQLLRRYEVIESLRDAGTSIGRRSVGPSTRRPGFVRIGWVSEGADVEGELAARSAEETIYELHFNEVPDPVFGTHKSIFHWILAVADTRV